MARSRALVPLIFNGLARFSWCSQFRWPARRLWCSPVLARLVGASDWARSRSFWCSPDRWLARLLWFSHRRWLARRDGTPRQYGSLGSLGTLKGDGLARLLWFCSWLAWSLPLARSARLVLSVALAAGDGSLTPLWYTRASLARSVLFGSLKADGSLKLFGTLTESGSLRLFGTLVPPGFTRD